MAYEGRLAETIGINGHALPEEAITIDFMKSAPAPGARVAVEPTLEVARELSGALIRAIAAAETEEAARPRGT